MAETETRALRPAANAAARMQEVLRRGAGDSPTPQDAISQADSTLLVADATRNEAADATSSAVGSTTVSRLPPQDSPLPEGHPAPRQKRKSTSSSAVAPTTRNEVADDTSSVVGSATGNAKANDPVRQAMLGMLAQPYPADMDDGAMTVTSVKIPKPVWERLEYARAITKKDKQDIIAEALRLYFARIVEESAQ